MTNDSYKEAFNPRVKYEVWRYFYIEIPSLFQYLHFVMFLPSLVQPIIQRSSPAFHTLRRYYIRLYDVFELFNFNLFENYPRIPTWEYL